MKNLFLLLLIIAAVQLYSQPLTPEVVSSAGDYFESPSAKISWTLGECMTETYNNSNNVITQGFQQTNLTLINIEDRLPVNINCKIYPNPASDKINIEFEGDINYNYTISILDINGKTVYIEDSKKSITSIDVSSLKPATYYLNVFDIENKISLKYKLLKIR
ncbi:MAG: hypothetical protein Kow0068_20270 [Marinilabiliales bacterium]